MYKLLTISLLLYAANVNNAEAQTDNIAQTKKTIAKSQSQITRQKAEEVAMLVMAPYIYDNNTTTMAVQCSRQDLQAAIDEMVTMTDLAEKESNAEMMLEAKGFQNVVVSITDEECDVVLDMGDVTDAKRAQVEDIVKRKTGVAAENIVITPIE